MLEDRHVVRYLSRNDGDEVSAEVPNAVRYDLTFRELAGAQGAFTTASRAWEIARDELPYQPQDGDRIEEVATGAAWSVGEVTETLLGHVWRLLCNKER